MCGEHHGCPSIQPTCSPFRPNAPQPKMPSADAPRSPIDGPSPLDRGRIDALSTVAAGAIASAASLVLGAAASAALAPSLRSGLELLTGSDHAHTRHHGRPVLALAQSEGCSFITPRCLAVVDSRDRVNGYNGLVIAA